MRDIRIHLTRKRDEPWGFRLIGGVDFNMPLTVVKVLPNTPADQAGLKNGDAVSSINGEPAAEMSHEDSRVAVAAAEEDLQLGVTRGLYDPVLDEYEPIYDTIDQDDFDQPSDPTEVLLPDPKDITDLLIRPPTTEPEFGPLNPESRSVTASPFVMPTKPYRPFSTEPIETIPPLEEPIILNPDFNDDFSKLGIDEDLLPKTRFKLPISEQYDPDGTKNKGIKTETSKMEVKQHMSPHTSTEMHANETTKHETTMKEEIQFLENMKSEIDLEKIEQTATSIVEESLQKATLVVEEINKETEVALHETVTSESKSAINLSVQEQQLLKDKIVSKDDSKELNKLVQLIDKTTDELVKQNETLDVNVTKQIHHFESIDKNKAFIDENKLLEIQDISELIESGTVKNKSVALEEKEIKVQQKDARFSVQEAKIRDTKSSTQASEQYETTQTKKTGSQSSARKSKTETKKSSSKRRSEQTAYILGLQTIPNIRGTIHSSYHFDMLLKTFFIHLTDVMVALSRFILSEPALTKDETDEEHDEEGSDEIITTTAVSKEQNSSVQETEADIKSTQKDKEEIYRRKQQEIVTQSIKDDKVKINNSMNIGKDYTETNIIEKNEKKVISGSHMAQLAEKKSEELTHKMDAVISEFQDKAGIEEVIIETESLEQVKAESRTETTHKSSESKEGRATYVAVVESHVYTNEDTILEEQFSETASVQSGEENFAAVTAIESGKVENLAKNNQVTDKVAENFQGEINLTSIETQEAVDKIEYQQKVDKMVADQTAIKYASEKIKQKIKQTATNEKNVTKSILKKTMESVNTQNTFQGTSVESKTQETINASMKETILEAATVETTPVQEIALREEVRGQECIIQEVSLDNLAINDMVTEPIVQEVIEPMIEISEKKDQIVIEDYKAAIKEEEAKALAVVVTEVNAEMAAIAEATKKVKQDLFIEGKEESLEMDIISKSLKSESNEFESLKITKEDVTEVSKAMEIMDETKIYINKYTEKNELESKSQLSTEYKIEQTNMEIQEHTFVGKTVEYNGLKLDTKLFDQEMEETKSEIQESTFVAKTVESKELKLNTEIAQHNSLSQVSMQSDENNNTSEPTTPVPPTPLTDEYIFKLQIPLPKGITPVPPDPKSPTPTLEDEDPHIVKKNLIPTIEAKIEDGIIYDPPLPTPPGSPKSPGSPTSNGCRPVYTKPGLRGGSDREEKSCKNISKEEILEIERKSSLLASAIDQTIKSIEEYKQEVGMDCKKASSETNGVIYNGYAKVVETRLFENDKYKSESNNVIEQPILTNVNDLQKVENAHNGNINAAEKKENIEGYRPIQFDAAEIQDTLRNLKTAQYTTMTQNLRSQQEEKPKQMYRNESGEIIGTHQGIVDGLEEAVVDPKVKDELGKPGMTEEKIAELISGESEMLREAHVMGLTRVLTAHMHRENDDSSVDFKRIKPIVESLKDSEVLKALNEELIKTHEEKKKEERKWTTFLQKPKRPVPKAKFGYHGYVPEETVEEPYKVKIVKQPKPKIAPDYKPEPEPSTVSVSSSPLHHHTIPSQKFETGLLPWEERALREPTPPPVAPEDPILVPEEAPEILEAVDPLPESEVPDLEDSGIPLPSPEEPTPLPKEENKEVHEEEEEEELDLEAVIEETEKLVEEKIIEEMEQNKIAEQLMNSVQNMVDPNAPLEQQLAQMRAQIAALAQLPCVIQQSLELVTKQLSQLSQMENSQTNATKAEEVNVVENEEAEDNTNETTTNEEPTEEQEEAKEERMTITELEEEQEEVKPTITAEEIERMKKEEMEMMEEQKRLEKQKKELMEEARREIEARQLKHRPTPRVGKPKPVFGPATPQERPLVLPGGRKWRKPKDAYNETFIRDTLASQAELIQGKAMGCSYESARLPYDERINFMKYEKPPVSLDHLQNSDTYKMIHNMEDKPLRRIETLTPAISEADYRERCRSMTPGLTQEQHNIMP